MKLNIRIFLTTGMIIRLKVKKTTKNSAKFQYITRGQEMKDPYRWFTQWPSMRLRDSRTTFIEEGFEKVTTIHQGIFIDIFPFDSMPPFTEHKRNINFEIACELMLVAAVPRKFKELMKTDRKFLINRDELEKFISQPFRQRGKIFDKFAEEIFFRSEKVGDMRHYGIAPGFSYDTKDFDKTVYLPFEEIEVPAPVNWDNVLKAQYGNWHKMIYTHKHAQEWSADIPYYEYYRTSSFMQGQQ